MQTLHTTSQPGGTVITFVLQIRTWALSPISGSLSSYLISSLSGKIAYSLSTSVSSCVKRAGFEILISKEL